MTKDAPSYKRKSKRYSRKLIYDELGRRFLAVAEALYLREARRLLQETESRHAPPLHFPPG